MKHKSSIFDLTQPDGNLIDEAYFKLHHYHKIILIMDRPIEEAYDFILYALKVGAEISVIIPAITKDQAQPIVDANDLKQMYQLLNVLVDREGGN